MLRLGRDVGVYERDEDDPAGGRAGDHGRRADEGRRDPGDGRGDAVTEAKSRSSGRTHRPPRPRRRHRRSICRRAIDNIRTGNLGVLPIVLGLVAHRRLLQLQGARTSSPPTTSTTSSSRWPGTCDARVRRRLRPAARRDRPLDRLPERPRGGRGGGAPAPRQRPRRPFGIIAPISGCSRSSSRSASRRRSAPPRERSSPRSACRRSSSRSPGC